MAGDIAGLCRGGSLATGVSFFGLEPWEHERRRTLLRRPMPWWLSMMLYGDGVPMTYDGVLELKRRYWSLAYTHDTTPIINEMREKFNELHTSMFDNFVRLIVAGAIAAGNISINEQIVPFITNDKTPLLGLIAAWAYMGFTGLSIICIMLMISPKYKEWRKGQEQSGADIGAQAIYNFTHRQWWEFLRLSRRYVHRQQLITFERRVQHVACMAIFLAYVAAATTFALV